MLFEWDEAKAKSNKRKHKVNFEEAEQAFNDQNAVELFDELNSEAEIRYQIIAAFARQTSIRFLYCPRCGNGSHYLGSQSRFRRRKDLQ